jgi:3-methyl-2-oxobutanoate hydroxymethyltransferase
MRQLLIGRPGVTIQSWGDAAGLLAQQSSALRRFPTAPMPTSRITVPEFTGFKAAGSRQGGGRGGGAGRKITMVTAYDYPIARLADAAGVEGILVGDSLSMVVQGHESTLPVTLDEMIYHAEMVGRAVEHALIVVDLPFPTFHLGRYKTIEAAGRILKETRAQAVKLEGGVEQAETIAALVEAGIPVMGHIGLRPQSVHTQGGYRVQRDAERLLADAKAAESAGAFAVVLECVPREIARTVTAALKIPTIGIGAGPECDGQVLVVTDLLGLTSGYVPRFVKKYADLAGEVTRAVTQFRDDVRAGKFPADEHGYG